MEHRKHCAKIKIDTGDASLSLKLFRSTEWPGHPQADHASFRLQKGRAWLQPNNLKYAFYDLPHVGHLVTRFLAEHGYIERQEAPRPDLRPGQRVRWTPSTSPDELAKAANGELESFSARSVQTYTLTIPVQTADGVWRVFLRGAEAGLVPSEPVPCDEVTPI